MRLLALCFYMLCLMSCSEAKPPQQQQLVPLYQDDKVKVSLSPADAPVEEILSWTLQLSQGWQVKHAEVTGLSMSMGTIPLLFKALPAEPQKFVSEMVLGACSQPRMQWQLQLELFHATLGEHLVVLPFYSSWPE